jgi:hypothetical protein
MCSRKVSLECIRAVAQLRPDRFHEAEMQKLYAWRKALQNSRAVISVARVAIADSPQAPQWHAFRIIGHSSQVKTL